MKVEPSALSLKGCKMYTKRSPLLLAFCAVVTVAVASTNATAGTKVTLGRTVPSGQRVSMDQIDHSAWDALLRKYVDGSGRVDYVGWKRSPRDNAALDGYLLGLSRGDMRRRTSREAHLAFWINAYNAVTMKGILREYPTSSIRNHTAKLYGYNIWHDLLLVVGDSKISLNDIEHNVLRKTGEPRIHFAIVCASRSCPRLLNEAYTVQKLEQQLMTNTQNFFAIPENFSYRNGTFYLSSILKWFAEDFGSTQTARLRAISPYLPDRTSKQAAANGTGRISYLGYDWRLNDQATPRTARR